MDATERAHLALTGGVFCGVVGSIIGSNTFRHLPVQISLLNHFWNAELLAA